VEGAGVRYAELHYFADPRFVINGATLFVWGVYDLQDGSELPVFSDSYGIAIDVTGMGTVPVTYAIYNPDMQTWSAPLSNNFVSTLLPYWQALWDNEKQSWSIGLSG